MKRIVGLLFLTSILYGVVAQSKSIKEIVLLNVLSIKDSTLIPILDTIISTEMKREYYQSNMLFSIHFNQDSTIIIQAIDVPYKINECGVILHKDTYFFVSGNIFDERVLCKSKKIEKYEFYKNSSYIDKKGRLVYIISHDDGFSKWQYKYNDKGFELLKFVNTEKKP
jgi:hypothetical protein